MSNEDVTTLKRKLAETEARILTRLLLSAQQALPPEQYQALYEKFQDNASIDLLQMERDISSAATTLSDNLLDLHEAVKDFRVAQIRMNEFEQGFWEAGEDDDPQMLANALLAARERMFSLVDEYDLKARVIKRNLIE